MNKIVLLSYPRCGNTWFRYCVEYVYDSPTLDGRDDSPLIKYLNRKYNYSKDVFMYKRHNLYQRYSKLNKNNKKVYTENNFEKLIFIIRNPIAIVNRENITNGDDISSLVIKNLSTPFEQYNNFNKDKLIIKFEDLYNNIENTLLQSFNFFEINYDKNRFNDLINNIDFHKNNSKKIYTKKQKQKSFSIDNPNLLLEKLSNEEYNIIKNKLNQNNIIKKYMDLYYPEINNPKL